MPSLAEQLIIFLVLSVGPMVYLVKSLHEETFWKTQSRIKTVYYFALFIFLMIVSRLMLIVLLNENFLLLFMLQTADLIADIRTNIIIMRYFVLAFNIVYWPAFSKYLQVYKNDQPIVKYVSTVFFEPFFLVFLVMMINIIFMSIF